MRYTPLILGVLVLVLGGVSLARGDEAGGEGDEAAQAVEALKARMEALEIEVRYLRAREKALTDYVLGHGERGERLRRAVADARRLGFTMAAIPPNSRERLLNGLEQTGTSLRSGLPQVDADQQALLKRVEALRKALR